MKYCWAMIVTMSLLAACGQVNDLSNLTAAAGADIK